MKNAIILDETANIKPDAWEDLKPCREDPSIILVGSTPPGRNFFYDLYDKYRYDEESKELFD